MSQMYGRSHAPRLRRPLSRVGAGTLGAIAGLLMVTGCAAGKDAATVEQKSVVDGVSADSGTIGIRNAGVQPPPNGASYSKGSSANLQLVIVNNGNADDRLTSVISGEATSVLLAPSTAGVGSSAESASSSGSGSASNSSSSASSSSAASASPRSTESSSAGASSSAGGSTPTTGPITVRANDYVQVGYDASSATITLVGLTQDIFPSQNVPVTLTFASGITIDALLPVKLTSGGPSAPTASISPPEAG